MEIIVNIRAFFASTQKCCLLDNITFVLYNVFIVKCYNLISNFQAGPVEKVSIPKDKEGRLRNFGFVTFKHEVSVGYAIQVMDGSNLFGRTLAMKNRKITEQQQQQQRGHQQMPYSHHQGEPIQEYMGRNLANQQESLLYMAQVQSSMQQNLLGQSLLALQGLQQVTYGNNQSNMLPQQRHNNGRRQNYNDYQQQDNYQQNSRQNERSNFHNQGGSHHDRDRSNNSRQHDRNVHHARNDRSRHNDKPYNRRHRR